jgi:hypothetical protein
MTCEIVRRGNGLGFWSTDKRASQFRPASIAQMKLKTLPRVHCRIVELEVYRRYRSKDEQAELDELRLAYPKAPSESALTKAIELRLVELQQQSK